MIDARRDWWCQAEAVIGFWNAFSVTGEVRFAEAAASVWDFIARELVDRVHGDLKAEVLLVSQFTILGDCRKGRRPSFDAAAPPETAEKLYEDLVQAMSGYGLRVATGRFRQMMDVGLVNDGPVTLLLDSKKVF